MSESDKKSQLRAAEPETVITAALSAFIGGLVAFSALVLMGTRPELQTQNGNFTFVGFLHSWQSLIGSILGSIVAVLLFLRQRKRDKQREKEQHLIALIHEIDRASRKIMLYRPWRPIVAAQLRIRLSSKSPSEKLNKIKDTFSDYIDPLRDFFLEIIDLLDSAPRTSIENMTEIVEIDTITHKIMSSIDALEEIREQLGTQSEIDAKKEIDAEKYLHTVILGLDQINTTWTDIDSLRTHLHETLRSFKRY